MGSKDGRTDSSTSPLASQVHERYLGADSDPFLLSEPLHEDVGPLLEIMMGSHDEK